MTPATTVPSARAIATATITFGMVAVPVKLYTTKESTSDISFNMHHDECKSRLKQQYVCTSCKDEHAHPVTVEREHTVRGYEHTKGQSVIFTAAELEQLETIATQTINIHEFVDADELDPLYVEGSYYLGPDKGAEPGMALLRDALAATDKVAIATYAAKGKERLGAIRERDGALVYHELRYAAEVRSAAGVPAFDVETKPTTLALAKKLIAKMSGSFDPSAYTDTVQARTREAIQKKIEGGEIAVQAADPRVMVETIEALRASLDILPTPAKAAKATPAPRSSKDRVQAFVKKATKRSPSRRAAGSR